MCIFRLFFVNLTPLVICNFRSPTCQALVLEIGETVQILEKSEGEIKNRPVGSVIFYMEIFIVSAVIRGSSSQS